MRSTVFSPASPLRVTFIGQRTYFEACVPPLGSTDLLTSQFIDFRSGEDVNFLHKEISSFAPHVVVVFRPEIIPPGCFADLPAIRLGYITEPLPRSRFRQHKDLHWRFSELKLTDPGNYDRFICFNPLCAAAADTVTSVWRSLPLPVNDLFFCEPKKISSSPRIGFIGFSTKYREHFLGEAKHYHDLFHVVHGLYGEELREEFARMDVAINVHNDAYPTFENRVLLHLAAGHLVLSEPLSPTQGLEPGIDFFELRGAWQLSWLMNSLRKGSVTFAAMRQRGRHKAEFYRASRVWPRLLNDVIRDVEVFGRSHL